MPDRVSDPPPQLPDRLQDDPPELDLFLHAVRVLLWDVAHRLDPTGADDEDGELGRRARALRAVVVRIIQRRDGGA